MVGLVVVEACEGQLFLDSVAVRPDARGQGVGRLLAFVDAHARALGLPEVRPYTNALMWENRRLHPRARVRTRGAPGGRPYDRLHHRKRLAS